MAVVGAVLFDFGSTLFAHDDLPTTIAAAARRRGHTPSAADVRRVAEEVSVAAMSPEELAGFPRDLDAAVWEARWKVLYGIADELGEGVGETVYALMHDPWEWQPYASTVDVLRALHRSGTPVGVISNTGWDVRGPFAVRGIETAVRSFTLSCELGAAKPAPAIFEAACASLGCPVSQVLMVGDDARADAGAVLHGLRTLLLPTAPPGADNGLDVVLGVVGLQPLR